MHVLQIHKFTPKRSTSYELIGVCIFALLYSYVVELKLQCKICIHLFYNTQLLFDSKLFSLVIVVLYSRIIAY